MVDQREVRAQAHWVFSEHYVNGSHRRVDNLKRQGGPDVRKGERSCYWQRPRLAPIIVAALLAPDTRNYCNHCSCNSANTSARSMQDATSNVIFLHAVETRLVDERPNIARSGREAF